MARGADCGRVCVSGFVAALLRPGGIKPPQFSPVALLPRLCGGASRPRAGRHARFFTVAFVRLPGLHVQIFGILVLFEVGKGFFLCYGFVGVRGGGVFHVEHGFFSCEQKSAKAYNLLRP